MEWDGTDRRQIDPLVAHFDARFDALEKLIRSGFPDGDIDGHRRVHEAYIRDAESRSQLKTAIIEKTVTGGIWGAVVLLGSVLWGYFKNEVKK